MKITESNQFKCVNCGAPAAALYKTYGPTVLKLTKCESCKGSVDKYIEYDPVIVMIDLVLLSKEAQRHVLYNTEFKAYWKLLVILMLVETYGVWHNNSLFSTVTNTLCGVHSTNNTSFAIAIDASWRGYWNASCWAWARDEKTEDSDPFIWEKDFYIQFMSTFAGIVVFILTVHVLVTAAEFIVPRQHVPMWRLLRALSLSHVSVLFTLPMLVWDADAGADATAHQLLVFAYSFSVFLTVFTVIYECPVYITSVILVFSNIAKYAASFHATPLLRTQIS